MKRATNSLAVWYGGQPLPKYRESVILDYFQAMGGVDCDILDSMIDQHQNNVYRPKAESVLKESRNIPSFSYSGDLELGVYWAFTFSVHRDSGQIDRSNWEVITNDLEKRFPDDIESVHCGHWAVGWIDHLAVKVWESETCVACDGIPAKPVRYFRSNEALKAYNDALCKTCEGRGHTFTDTVSQAFIATLKWQERIEDYIIADEDHYSDLSYNENYESMLDSVRCDSPDLIDDLPDDWQQNVINWIRYNDEQAYDRAYDSNDGWLSWVSIKNACDALGYTDLENND
jgi:hypothetical protein